MFTNRNFKGKMRIKIIFQQLGLFYLLGLFACRKGENPDPLLSVDLIIQHQNLGQKLAGGVVLSDSSGTLLQLNKYQFYLSNIRLETDVPIEVFSESASGHLVKGLDPGGESVIPLSGIPLRNYRYLCFGIGLDSLKNKSGGQGIPDLDPGLGMFWPWSNEYKFMVLEGSFQTQDTTGAFLFHIAGNSCYREIRLPLRDSTGKEIVLNASGKTRILLNTELSALFGAPRPVDFRVLNNVMSVASGADVLADNYGQAGFIRLKGKLD